MKSNLKWTVLAVAISAAAAAQADEPSPPASSETIIVYDEDVTIDDTRNYETNVTNTTVNYSDTFDWNTKINEEYNSLVNEEVNRVDSFEWYTTINEEMNTLYNSTTNYTDNFDWSTTIDETFVSYDERVNVDRDIDSHEMAVSLKKSLSLSSDIAFSGSPTVSGDIKLDSAAIAVIDNRQSVGNNLGDNQQLENEAAIGDDTGTKASGNLQFNVAAGDNNVQDNAAALSAADASFAFGLADAEIFVNQAGVSNQTMNLGVTNSATVSGNAFSDAAGNIGVNVTSGNNNAQKNALAASVATSAYAQASVSSNQVSGGNMTLNAPLLREGSETVEISLSGTVQGETSARGSGGYTGTAEGSYAGRGNAYQQDNFYLDTWDGQLNHPSGGSTGHLDMDNEIQNAVGNPYKDGVGGIAFDTDEKGDYAGSEEGDLSFSELGYADLEASLSGTLEIPTTVVVADARNSATLSGSAFARASGNIGVNVSAGTGNQQANSLAMAVAQPSAAPPPSNGGGEGG
ncbi:MAG: adhesin [Xanthomonadales bacterium]|nr:adhesin [Xanthomonadales bacterium]